MRRGFAGETVPTREHNVLNFAGDAGEDELIEALERTFDIELGPAARHWRTVGDVHDAVLERFDARGAGGACATSMAFYRLRAALRREFGCSGRIGPNTPLKGLARRAPSAVVRRLERALGGRLEQPSTSWIGLIGLLGVVIGGLAALASLLTWRIWPGAALLPLGYLLLRFDPGVWGPMTVGNLAGSYATLNFVSLAREGACASPEVVWRVVRGVAALVDEENPQLIDRETRLFREKPASKTAAARSGR